MFHLHIRNGDLNGGRQMSSSRTIIVLPQMSLPVTIKYGFFNNVDISIRGEIKKTKISRIRFTGPDVLCYHQSSQTRLLEKL